MSTEYTNDVLRVVVAKICQTIGWHSIQPTPLNIIIDILRRYLLKISNLTISYTNLYGRTQPSLDELGLAFRDMNINISDLEEYVKCFESAPALQVPLYPVKIESHLNFLNPDSQEAASRPEHIYKYLPPMFPEIQERKEEPAKNAYLLKRSSEVASDVSGLKRVKFSGDEEGSKPARKGKMAEATSTPVLSANIAFQSEDSNNSIHLPPGMKLNPVAKSAPKNLKSILKSSLVNAPAKSDKIVDGKLFAKPDKYKVRIFQKIMKGKTGPKEDYPNVVVSEIDKKNCAFKKITAEQVINTFYEAKGSFPDSIKNEIVNKTAELNAFKEVKTVEDEINKKNWGKYHFKKQIEVKTQPVDVVCQKKYENCHSGASKQILETKDVKIEKPTNEIPQESRESPSKLFMKETNKNLNQNVPKTNMKSIMKLATNAKSTKKALAAVKNERKRIYSLNDLIPPEVPSASKSPTKSKQLPPFTIKKTRTKQNSQDPVAPKQTTNCKLQVSIPKLRLKIGPSPQDVQVVKQELTTLQASQNDTRSSSSSGINCTTTNMKIAMKLATNEKPITIATAAGKSDRKRTYFLNDLISPEISSSSKSPKISKQSTPLIVEKNKTEQNPRSTSNLRLEIDHPPQVVKHEGLPTFNSYDSNKIWICPACVKEDDGSAMIGCDGCDEWYHWVCVGIQEPPDEQEDWFCEMCIVKKYHKKFIL